MWIFIGYDSREPEAFEVAKRSILCHSPLAKISGIHLNNMKKDGLYWRPTLNKEGHLWDVISDAPMSTEFSISRFLTYKLACGLDEDWVLFMDCDMLIRTDIEEIMEYADPQYALMCVKHQMPEIYGIKMDGCKQLHYDRKNWSSVMLINMRHKANEALTVEFVNNTKGKDLHRFCWLKDSEIGALPMEWNYLVGINPTTPKIAHFTLGIPTMPGYEHSDFSDEWRSYLRKEDLQDEDHF